jgi:predicted membrane protein
MEVTLNPYVKLYALISAKTDEATAKEAVTILEEVVKEKVIIKTQQLATKSDIADVKAEMIKWMFLFWIGQVAVTFGFILLFLKK